VPMVDLIEESFVVAAPGAVAAAVHDPAVTRRLWPDLELTVFQDRADAGVRWSVTGGLVGSAEVWVEPWGDGAILHVYVRADVTRRTSATDAVTGRPARLAHRAARERRRRSWTMRRALHTLKRQLEGDRAAGVPRAE
jgi:hypothetical protein